jgi:hypothetical protein
MPFVPLLVRHPRSLPGDRRRRGRLPQDALARVGHEVVETHRLQPPVKGVVVRDGVRAHRGNVILEKVL